MFHKMKDNTPIKKEEDPTIKQTNYIFRAESGSPKGIHSV